MKASFDQVVEHYSGFAAIRREEGIVEVRVHSDGGSARYSGEMHEGFGHLFSDLNDDKQNRILILTGTGERFMSPPDMSVMEQYLPYTAALHVPQMGEAFRAISDCLNLEIPMIAAVNGPVTGHAELALMADILIASDDTYFSEFHFVNGIIPGDGTHILWPLVLGARRGQYFILTGQRITSEEGRQLGFVSEVVPKADLLARAWELARQLARQNDVTLRATRLLYTQPLKQQVQDQLLVGIALEGLGSINHWPLELREG